MSPATLQEEIEKAIPILLNMARDLSWNKISDNCQFILSEIINSDTTGHEERDRRLEENKKKTSVAFSEIMPMLRHLYDNLYDINLHIYKSSKKLTIIDIRYYRKSSLDEDYRQKIINDPPMLHCKVSLPPWLSDKKEKFNINWEHNRRWILWKNFWQKRKLRIEERKRNVLINKNQ
jgi:hypothetical protein